MPHFHSVYHELVKKAIIKRCGVMLPDDVGFSRVILRSVSFPVILRDASFPVILRDESPEESKRCFAYAQHDGKKEILRFAQDDGKKEILRFAQDDGKGRSG